MTRAPEMTTGLACGRAGGYHQIAALTADFGAHGRVLQCRRLHSMQIGVGSPEKQGARPPLKSGHFFARRSPCGTCFGGPGGGAFGLAGALLPVFQPFSGHLLRLEAKEVVLHHKQGAFTMAGQLIGASAPQSPASTSAPRRPLRIVASSRTRRNHGVFLVGDELTTVYSSRRASESRGVTVSVGNGSTLLSGSMTPVQARAFAHALMTAAAAVDAQGVSA